MSDATGLAEAMLGLEGFTVLAVREDPSELVISVESTAVRVGCAGCGVRAQAQDRVTIDVRDLACFGRPTRLVWRKRRWRCREERCTVKTWTEESPAALARQLIAWRAGLEACRQVGELARPVSTVAAELGVSLWTVMHAVIEHGTRLVDDPARVGPVTQIGVDETSFLAANRDRHTVYVSTIVDLQRHVVVDVFDGNTAADLRKWVGRGVLSSLCEVSEPQ